MPRTLHIRLLGDFSLVYGDESVTSINTARLHSLLAYLVLHRDAPHSRQHLAFLFWPDATEAQARNNLRQLLHQLRHALPDADRFLYADASTLRWRLDAPSTLDVDAFERALALADAAGPRADQSTLRAALEQATHLYRADLLDSCYDDWIAPERERLCQRHLQALAHLVQLLETQRDYAQAIRYAQRLVRHNPLDEDAARRLMQLLTLNGDRAGALRVYHTYTTTLQCELGLEPSTPTREAYERLLHMDAQVAMIAGRHTMFTVTLPLIGRRREWAQLQAAWRQAARAPRFVLVTGEAGIGKSRLLDELVAWANQQGIITAKTRCYAAEGQLSLSPVSDWLHSEALRPHLAQLDSVWLTEVSRILPELSTERPDLPRYEPMPEYGQRQRFFESLARAALAAPQPILLLIDDLQWCDQETLEWLHFLLRFDPAARLLLVGSARAEETSPQHPLNALVLHLHNMASVTEIALEPLDVAETAKLAAQITNCELDVETATRLYHETEGNPLFVVETMRAGFESLGPGAWSLGSDNQAPNSRLPDLPPKVQAVIAGRLAQLSAPARELVGLAATIGRAFSLEVLVNAGNADENSAVRGLDELWQKHIVREQGANHYDFTHDKLREVAYAQISTPQRRLLHHRIAQALEAINARDLDPVSSQIASHYDQAGMAEQAIMLYQRAAAVAQRIYANEEAINLFNKGLTLVHTLPQSTARDELELALQTALGVSLVASRGYRAPEVIAVYRQAQALCQSLGKPPLPSILRALAIGYAAHTEFQRARDVGEQLLGVGERTQDTLLIVEGHYALGITLFYQGLYVLSRTHLEQAIVHYDPRQSRAHIALYTQDPKVVCLSRLALDLWCLGYPDQAAMAREEALAIAQELSHPFSTGYIFGWDALLQSICLNIKATRASAEAAIAISREHRLGQWLPMGTVFQGWARAEQGEIEVGMAELEEATTAFGATGAEFLHPYFLALLAGLKAKVGQIDQSLNLLTEALALVDKSGERWCEAELYRRKGDLLLLRQDEAGAQVAFERALAIARSQQAKSLELRAATSLARLWRSQGRPDQAMRLLDDLCAWFTEGFNTLDIQAAQALLARL